MLFAVLFACGHAFDTGGAGADALPVGCGPAIAGDAAAVYDPAVLHQVRLTVGEAALDALRDAPREYVRGDVEVDGVVVPDVGVRLKGNSSFEDLDGKAAFKVKFDELCPGRTWLGLERLTLNNMVSDPTQSQELVNYPLFAAAGLPASRVSYAEVSLNGEAYGLYANVESVDEVWLDARFADGSGDLWEAADGAEFTVDGVESFELKSGAGDRDALRAVAAALDGEGDRVASLEAVLDLDQVLAYWAWKVVVGDPDGYPWNPNDLFVYGDPDRGGRFVFAPWGFDEGWQDYVAWDNAEGRLAVVCLADAACRARLHAAVVLAVDQFEAIDVSVWAEAAWALSAPVLADDPRRPYTETEVLAARKALAATMAGRAAVVRHDLE